MGVIFKCYWFYDLFICEGSKPISVFTVTEETNNLMLFSQVVYLPPRCCPTPWLWSWRGASGSCRRSPRPPTAYRWGGSTAELGNRENSFALRQRESCRLCQTHLAPCNIDVGWLGCPTKFRSAWSTTKIRIRNRRQQIGKKIVGEIRQFKRKLVI